MIFPGVARYIFDKADHNPADNNTKYEWKIWVNPLGAEIMSGYSPTQTNMFPNNHLR